MTTSVDERGVPRLYGEHAITLNCTTGISTGIIIKDGSSVEDVARRLRNLAGVIEKRWYPPRCPGDGE